MTKITLRVDLVAHPLLQYLRFGETTVGLALPDLHAIAGDAEDTPGTRLQRYPAKVVGKGTEQFLSQPGSTQQPLALGAIGDDDFRLVVSHGETSPGKGPLILAVFSPRFETHDAPFAVLFSARPYLAYGNRGGTRQAQGRPGVVWRCGPWPGPHRRT
ncbi:hypothetical protein METHP14_80061 [Pseudomonas sp. P14-2025]